MNEYSGILNFGEKEIPFFQKDFTLYTITKNTNPFQRLLTAEKEETKGGFVLGTTHSGRVIAIYTGHETVRTDVPLRLSTYLYVVSKNNMSDIWDGDSFDGIVFYGGCVDNIYHGHAFDIIENETSDGVISIKENHDSIRYDFSDNDEIIHVQFDTASNNSLDEKGFSISDICQCLRLVFDQSKSICELPSIISNVMRFIAFLIYRQQLYFNKVYLTKKDSDGKNDIIAIVNLKYEAETGKSGLDCFDIEYLKCRLSEITSLLWKNELGSIGYIPKKDNDALFVESFEIKEICSALEYEINHSDILQEENEHLNDLVKSIKSVVKSHRESENRLPDKTYDLIFSSISHWSNSLSDKIIALRDKHIDAVKEIQSKYSFVLTDERIAVFVKFRNHTSHGIPEILTEELAGSATILKGLIYCNILSRAGFSEETIVNICKNVRFLN